MKITKGIPARSFLQFISILTALCITVFSAGALLAAGADDELMDKAKSVFGPLPASMPSPDNPITPAKEKLGRALFYESRISIDRTVSCAKCHPMSLYAVDGLKKAVGNNCKVIPRNSPTLFNAAAQISQHWIGNRTSVEDQAKQSVTGPPAFGMPSNESVEKILEGMKGYRDLFKEAFPQDKKPVTIENFAKAVGAFERTLVTPAPFDDYVKGKAGALSAEQKRGLKTFLDTGCMMCHAGPYFGGQMYQKFGMMEPYEKYTKSQPVDEGRFAVTKDPADKYVFKVPVLRNVAGTPPYFHDGSVERLEDAVVIMAKVQLGKDLTKEQAGDIAVFLGSLTGKIPEPALIIPVLPTPD
ncbi:MAG TPA: cytochrome c peroxidase [Nitrospirota bacterium]|nr:cytochrome c peroxidase [Nitrospirota bacterium]